MAKLSIEDIAGELKGLIDGVSVSLNASTAEEYDRLCKSFYGVSAYAGILEFIKDCR